MHKYLIKSFFKANLSKWRFGVKVCFFSPAMGQSLRQRQISAVSWSWIHSCLLFWNRGNARTEWWNHSIWLFRNEVSLIWLQTKRCWCCYCARISLACAVWASFRVLYLFQLLNNAQVHHGCEVISHLHYCSCAAVNLSAVVLHLHALNMKTI